MGFHAYLQKNSIPFEESWSVPQNMKCLRHKRRALEETRRLAVERGACPDDDSCEVRNAHLLAIAPNAVLVLFAETQVQVLNLFVPMLTLRKQRVDHFYRRTNT